MRTMIGIPAALLAALVLSSCASSDRMVRMSGGALGSYEAPKAERVANFEAKAGAVRRTGDQLNGLDQSLVNIWPLFFRNADYYSVLWPMIDRDPYGFAVRPFYNQEGNEHAVLFPLSAWNPANGDGWALNAWWTPGRFSFFPFFLHSSDERLSFYGPFWTGRGDWGFFPLAATGKDWGYALNTWWRSGRDGKLEQLTSLPLFSWRRQGFNHYLLLYADRNREGNWRMWGIAPGLCHFGDCFRMVTLAWWELNDQNELEKGGFFPLLRFSPQLNYVTPAWWRFGGDGKVASCGFWPLYRFKSSGDQYFFPLYSIENDGSFFLSPVAGWQNTPEKSMLSVLGPLWYRSRETPAASDNGLEGLKEENFQLVAAMPYWGSKETYRMPVSGVDSRSFRPESWGYRKPLIHHRLSQLGIAERPQTYSEFKALAGAIKAKRTVERTDYWGFFPLLSRSASDRESRTTALLGLLGYCHRKANWSYSSVLTPLVFTTESRSNVRPGELEWRNWLALPLLAGGEHSTRYPVELCRQLSELQSLGWKFGQNTEYNAYLRIRAGMMLRELGVKTAALPDYVCDVESMHEFVESLRGELPNETESVSSCTFFPLFTVTRKPHDDAVVLWALMSGWGHDGWLSLPLLSGGGKKGRAESISLLFPLYVGQTLSPDETVPVVEIKVLEKNGMNQPFKSDFFGAGMLFFRNRATYRTPAVAGQAAAINQVLDAVKRWERADTSLIKAETRAAELLAALRSAKPELADRRAVEAFAKNAKVEKRINSGEPFFKEIIELSSLWAECDRLPQVIAECRTSIAGQLPALAGTRPVKAPATLADAQMLAEKLNAEAVILTEEQGIASLLWGCRQVGDFSDWRVFLGLFAEGERRGTEQSSISIFKLLYRHQQEGARSDTLVFPFVSMRRDGDDYRFNFLHRVFSTYREKGKSGGYFFYIPF